MTHQNLVNNLNLSDPAEIIRKMLEAGISMSIIQLLPHDFISDLAKKVPPDENPIWDFWLEFIEKYLRTGRSEITVKGVRDGLRFAIRKLDILTIEQLNNHNIVEEKLFEYKRIYHIKSSTFNSYRKYFNTFCIWLQKRGYIQENLMAKVEKCKEEHREQLTLNEGQVMQVVAHIHDRKQTYLQRVRNVFFIDLLRFTGARPCELLELKLKNVRPEKSTYMIVISGKKQKGRNRYYTFPSFLHHSYMAYVSYRSQIRPYNENSLFISTSKKGPWTSSGLKRLFTKISKELGFKVTPYSFRRYVATKLYNKEVPIEKISNYLGHTRVTTTQRYIERSGALTKDCGEVMGMS